VTLSWSRGQVKKFPWHPLSSDKNGGTKNGVASPLCKGSFARPEPAIITDTRSNSGRRRSHQFWGYSSESLTPETYREASRTCVDAKDGPRKPKIGTYQIPISTKGRLEISPLKTQHPSQAFNYKMVRKRP
jgi:hypothetical protein